MKDVTLTSEELEIILKYVHAIEFMPCRKCSTTSIMPGKSCYNCLEAEEWRQHFNVESKNYDNLLSKYSNWVVGQLAFDIQEFIDSYRNISIEFERYNKVKNKLCEQYPDILNLLVPNFCDNVYFDKCFYLKNEEE